MTAPENAHDEAASDGQGPHGSEPLQPTPSHTVGPFYGYALPFPGGGDVAPVAATDTVTLHGYVRDGSGAPVPDALIELWQADEDGGLAGAPGSMRRDPVDGGHLGRNGVDFTGFARVPTDADGHWTARTVKPGARPGHPPYISVCVFARGLLHHLFTRVYFPEDTRAHTDDPLLASLDAERRETLLATAEGATGSYRFDIRLQGEKETVFLDFHR